MKALYEVRAEVVVYVMADDREDAYEIGRRSLSEEVSCNEIEPSDWERVTNRNWTLDGGWNRDARVYGGGRSLTLGEALDALPEVSQ